MMAVETVETCLVGSLKMLYFFFQLSLIILVRRDSREWSESGVGIIWDIYGISICTNLSVGPADC